MRRTRLAERLVEEKKSQTPLPNIKKVPLPAGGTSAR